jgi:hypothetical protein
MRDGDYLEDVDIDGSTVSRDRKCICKRNVGACPCNHFSVGRSVTYSEYVPVALGIQHAKRMRRILLPSSTCLAVAYFLHITSQTAVFSGWGISC